MARPGRRDADYFPFIVKRGRTFNVLQSKHGLEGVGFCLNLFRLLTSTPDHHYCIKEELDRMNFFSEIGMPDEEKGIEIIELMVKTEKLDKELWEESSVIACRDLLLSLEDAYKNRKTKIITIEEIRVKFKTAARNASFLPDDDAENTITYQDNPQTKLKDTKLKEFSNSVELPPVSKTTSLTAQSLPKSKGHIELTEEQKPLFHAARLCFESDPKAKALLYQDKNSTARQMKDLKTLVIRCTNMAPGITADFLRNVLEHFRALTNGRLKNKAAFTPCSLATRWVWELVIESLPENTVTPELQESIRGLFK